MPRIMYDSVNPFAIPEHAQMVLVYVDGIWKWSQAGRDRFKYSQQVTCSAVGAVTAQVGDVELGCIWPVEKAVPWVLRSRADGYDPTIYINEKNDWGPCREAFRRAGVPEPHWLVANYNGVVAIPPGAIGRQYAHPSVPLGNPNNLPWHTAGHWDESVVADYWPGVDDGGPGGGGGGGTMTVEIVKEGIKSLLDGMTNGSETWAKEALQTVLTSAKIEIKDEATGEVLWEDTIGGVIGAIDRRLVRVEQKAVADVDEAALAEEMERRGLGGTDPAVVKAALSEVLRTTRFEPSSAG